MSVGEKLNWGESFNWGGFHQSRSLIFHHTSCKSNIWMVCIFKVLNFENSAPMPTVVKVCQVTRVQNWGFTSLNFSLITQTRQAAAEISFFGKCWKHRLLFFTLSPPLIWETKMHFVPFQENTNVTPQSDTVSNIPSVNRVILQSLFLLIITDSPSLMSFYHHWNIVLHKVVNWVCIGNHLNWVTSFHSEPLTHSHTKANIRAHTRTSDMFMRKHLNIHKLIYEYAHTHTHVIHTHTNM